MVVKQKKCKVCKQPYSPFNSLQTACSTKCALTLAETNLKRKYKQETTSMRRQFNHKDLNYWKTRATIACHAYIKARDGNFCISQGKHTYKQIHAGHYRSRAAQSSLKFHWANVNSQSAQDNTYRSGNITAYRINLIKKVGLPMVEFLEQDHKPYKWTIEDYQGVIWWFKLLLANLTPPDAR